jgi:hypothetical protein
MAPRIGKPGVGRPRRLTRRAVLQGGAAIAASLLAAAHTPYEQWVVYRKRRLLIGCSRAEPESYDLAKAVAAALLERLPESQAGVSRAPDKFRLASLLSTDQMDVALLLRDDALALARGRAPFRDYGAVPLAVLYAFGDYLLISRADFPEHHAYLVARALNAAPAGVPNGGLPPDGLTDPPAHPGTLAYARGLPPPEAEHAASDHDHGHDHPH